MYQITLLDRIIIRSISKKNINLSQISEDTALEERIAKNILQDLVVKNILKIQNDEYRINPHLNDDQINLINNKQDLQIERKQMVNSLIENELLHLEKFYLSSKDKVIFEAMVKNLQLFIQGTKKNNGSTKEETLFFWGQEQYKNVMDYVLLD